jgi:hypothetical protein
MRKIGELEQEMTEANALVCSGRLADADAAAVVRVERGEAITTDGPFTETKEQIGGFYIVKASDFEEALSWAAKTSACVGRPIEVRPFAAPNGWRTLGSRARVRAHQSGPERAQLQPWRVRRPAPPVARQDSRHGD